MTMTAASTAAAADLFLAFIVLDILPFLDPQQQQLGADLPAAQAALALLVSAVELLLPLAAMGILTTASTAIYLHLVAGAAGIGNHRRRLGRLFAILCASVATLELFFFVVKPAELVVVAGNVGAQQALRALGLVAARVLPVAAAATFFVGMALVIVVVAHIRTGGEGGGGRGAFIQGAVLFLTKAAFAAAAALIWLTILALCGCAYTERKLEEEVLTAGYI